MNDKAKAARNAYKRAWAKKHPDRVKVYEERYWTKKAAEAEKLMQAEQAQPAQSPAASPAEN